MYNFTSFHHFKFVISFSEIRFVLEKKKSYGNFEDMLKSKGWEWMFPVSVHYEGDCQTSNISRLSKATWDLVETDCWAFYSDLAGLEWSLRTSISYMLLMRLWKHFQNHCFKGKKKKWILKEIGRLTWICHVLLLSTNFQIYQASVCISKMWWVARDHQRPGLVVLLCRRRGWKGSLDPSLRFQPLSPALTASWHCGLWRC